MDDRITLPQFDDIEAGKSNLFCKHAKSWIFLNHDLLPESCIGNSVSCEDCEHHEYKEPNAYFKCRIKEMLEKSYSFGYTLHIVLDYIDARQMYEKRKFEIEKKRTQI